MSLVISECFAKWSICLGFLSSRTGKAFRRYAVLLLFFPLCGLLISTAWAQNDMAAQEFQRRQERDRILREQQERVPDVRLALPETDGVRRLPEVESPCFYIHRIVLVDESQSFGWATQAADIPGDEVQGRCLGSQGINIVMQRIQNAIVARGYVTTRVLAAGQDLRNGELVLTVVPGRIRAIRFTDGSSARAYAGNALPTRPGDLLNLRDIEQALENFKRVPSVEADIQIVPADLPGESDLLIAWRQGFPLRVSLSANDGGARSTGRYQGSFTVSGDHLLALNDLFYASLGHDLGGGKSGERGTQGHTLHYSLPWKYWNFGMTQSVNRYHQSVAGASQNYRYSGTSENYEIKLAKLLRRDANSKTTGSLRAYLTKSSNFIDDTEVDVQRRRMSGWEAALAHRVFIGGATLDASLAYRHGNGAFSARPAPEEKFDEGTAHPQIISTETVLNLPFRAGGQRLHYNGTWKAQWNRTPLVPQDRFSIGGRYTVRGFDGESSLMAERGWLLRNDLGWMFGNSGQEAYVGIDHGRVGGPSSDLLVGKRLRGAVLGLKGAYKGGSWDIFSGFPIKKPDGFRTAHMLFGFNMSWTY